KLTKLIVNNSFTVYAQDVHYFIEDFTVFIHTLKLLGVWAIGKKRHHGCSVVKSGEIPFNGLAFEITLWNGKTRGFMVSGNDDKCIFRNIGKFYGLRNGPVKIYPLTYN